MLVKISENKTYGSLTVNHLRENQPLCHPISFRCGTAEGRLIFNVYLTHLKITAEIVSTLLKTQSAITHYKVKYDEESLTNVICFGSTRNWELESSLQGAAVR